MISRLLKIRKKLEYKLVLFCRCAQVLAVRGITTDVQTTVGDANTHEIYEVPITGHGLTAQAIM
jgi:hypothetical protein